MDPAQPGYRRPQLFRTLAPLLLAATLLGCGTKSAEEKAALDVEAKAPQEEAEKGDAKALAELRGRAEKGEASAQFGLGVMYANGRGVAKDEVEAVKWYRKAADQGDARAQYNLGLMYANGQGVAKDEVEAVKWHLKAAAQGHADAQFNLGLMYALGEGVPKDAFEAVKWYRKAADQGDARAQYNLGQMYDFGQGVAKDEVEAEEGAFVLAAIIDITGRKQIEAQRQAALEESEMLLREVHHRVKRR